LCENPKILGHRENNVISKRSITKILGVHRPNREQGDFTNFKSLKKIGVNIQTDGYTDSKLIS
jgi:hypothetical protein